MRRHKCSDFVVLTCDRGSPKRPPSVHKVVVVAGQRQARVSVKGAITIHTATVPVSEGICTETSK